MSGRGWRGREGVSAPLGSPPSAPAPHTPTLDLLRGDLSAPSVFSSSLFRGSSPTALWLGELGWEDHSAPSWLPQTSGLTVGLHLVSHCPAAFLEGTEMEGFPTPSVCPAPRRLRSFLETQAHPRLKEACFVQDTWALPEPFPPSLPLAYPLFVPQAANPPGPSVLTHPTGLSRFPGFLQGKVLSRGSAEVSAVYAGALARTVPKFSHAPPPPPRPLPALF